MGNSLLDPLQDQWYARMGQHQDDSVQGLRVRKLAALEALSRSIMDEIKDEELSATEAVVLLQVSESLKRNAQYLQVRAAGSVVRTEAHRLHPQTLGQLQAVTSISLTSGAGIPPARFLAAAAKARFRSGIDLIGQLTDTNFFAAKSLVAAHRQLVGSAGQPAQFAQLAKEFSQAGGNPGAVASAAAKLGKLQLSGPARTSAEQRVAHSLGQGHSALKAELKYISDALSAPNLPEREAVHERCAGLRYRGLGPYGYVWELTCTSVDHEFLVTLADRLANPKLAANQVKEESPLLDPQPDPAAERARKLLRAVLDISRQQLMPGAGVGQNLLAGRDTGAGAALVLPTMLDLIVTIDYAALREASDGAGLTAHGERISATRLRQSAAIGGIIPVILGSAGEVLDVGRRRRLFTAAQTRAVVARDRGCINPGCSMPAHRCEVNHRQPWYKGGKTSVNNACLLCKSCHMAFHAGHFCIQMVEGIPYVLQSVERDAQQRWRRNWVWHPNSPALADHAG